MHFWKTDFVQAWNDMCSVIGLSPIIGIFFAVGVFVITVLILHKLFGWESTKKKLIEAGVGIFATCLLASIIFFIYFIFISPDKIIESKDGQIINFSNQVVYLNKKLTNQPSEQKNIKIDLTGSPLTPEEIEIIERIDNSRHKLITDDDGQLSSLLDLIAISKNNEHSELIKKRAEKAILEIGKHWENALKNYDSDAFKRGLGFYPTNTLLIINSLSRQDGIALHTVKLMALRESAHKSFFIYDYESMNEWATNNLFPKLDDVLLNPKEDIQ